MFKPSAPRAYVTKDYLEYQQRYATNMRESDKALLGLIREAAGGYPPGKKPSLLDIGCSNGNFLGHLKRELPGLDYHGGDLFPEIVEHNRANPNLAGITFEVMDIRDLGNEPRFDLVVANAVIHRFRDEEFALALGSIARVTRPGGWLFAFEFFHPFEQELETVERTRPHPEGLTLVVRPYSKVGALLESLGYGPPEFRPFAIPIDLPRPDDPADVGTYTVRAEGHDRLNFRGSFYMPWCYLVARKR